MQVSVDLLFCPQVHQTFMVLTLLLTSGGFVVIFLQMRTDFPVRTRGAGTRSLVSLWRLQDQEHGALPCTWRHQRTPLPGAKNHSRRWVTLLQPSQ